MLHAPFSARIAALLFLIPFSAGGVDFTREPGSEGLQSDSGVVALEWGIDSEEGTEFEVEQSTMRDHSDARIIYQGPDRSTHLTGFREGDYFFRVREVGGGSWSKPFPVEVKFISRTKLYILLTVGFLVCFLTIGAILVGHQRMGEE